MLKQHTLQTTGIWRVYGEDPNADMGGHHHEPYLATLEGKLENVIRYAVTIPGFFSWGAGGRIEKCEIRKV